MDESQRWRVSASSELSWRVWGDDVIVYHHGSADTHKLNQLSAHALRCLEKTPLTIRELSARLADSMGPLMADDELHRYTDKLLVQFDELGLIEPVS